MRKDAKSQDLMRAMKEKADQSTLDLEKERLESKDRARRAEVEKAQAEEAAKREAMQRDKAAKEAAEAEAKRKLAESEAARASRTSKLYEKVSLQKEADMLAEQRWLRHQVSAPLSFSLHLKSISLHSGAHVKVEKGSLVLSKNSQGEWVSHAPSASAVPPPHHALSSCRTRALSWIRPCTKISLRNTHSVVPRLSPPRLRRPRRSGSLAPWPSSLVWFRCRGVVWCGVVIPTIAWCAHNTCCSCDAYRLLTAGPTFTKPADERKPPVDTGAQRAFIVTPQQALDDLRLSAKAPGKQRGVLWSV